MTCEFINDKLAFFRFDKTDRIWFFKSDDTVKAIAVPDGSHFTITGHTDKEVFEEMTSKPFGKRHPDLVRFALVSVFKMWM